MPFAVFTQSPILDANQEVDWLLEALRHREINSMPYPNLFMPRPPRNLKDAAQSVHYLLLHNLGITGGWEIFQYDFQGIKTASAVARCHMGSGAYFCLNVFPLTGNAV